MAWDADYRLLLKDEIILDTDEVYDDVSKTWVATLNGGQKAPDPNYTSHRKFRRKKTPMEWSLDLKLEFHKDGVYFITSDDDALPLFMANTEIPEMMGFLGQVLVAFAEKKLKP